MKRFHMNVTVDDIEQSIGFYSTLFGSTPDVVKPDYAKWMLDDPRINFAITTHGSKPGIDHVGIQAESDAELTEIRDRLQTTQQALFDQPDAQCCYAQSTKTWVHDLNGIAWETFLTHGQSTVYGDDTVEESVRIAHKNSADSGCCGQPQNPATKQRCC